MDILIVIHKKGISSLKELTQNIINNLNFRDVEVHSFKRSGGFLNCSYVGDIERHYDNSVKDSEIIKYLSLLLGIDKDQAKKILENLIEMVFFKKTYTTSHWTKDSKGWSSIISPNI